MKEATLRLLAHPSVFQVAIKLKTLLLSWRHARANQQYRRANPDRHFPSFRLMYETYGTSYRDFNESGQDVSNYVAELIKTHHHGQQGRKRVLDIGCGVGRVTYYLAAEFDTAGCDINKKMIVENMTRLADRGIRFAHMPTPVTIPFTSQFDFALCISIITHMEVRVIGEFLQAIHVALDYGGLLLITTQGDSFTSRMTETERLAYQSAGHYERRVGDVGNRYYSTYLSPIYFYGMIEGQYEVVTTTKFTAADTYANGRPKQDVHLLRKKG